MAQFASQVLTLLAAIALLAPVNYQVELRRTNCQIDRATGKCCCETTPCEDMSGVELSCCSGDDETSQSTPSLPHENDGGCPCGNCSCRVIICCGHAMPFLSAPAMVTGSHNPLVNSQPVPNMDITGDACLQGVFHPPRC